jgi:uncharacterized membrane protein YphA (DoxX/SURF4 family)
MLSVFPTLLAYGLIGISVLRVTIGVSFLALGYRALTKERTQVLSNIRSLSFLHPLFTLILLATLQFIIGLSFLVGLYTQIGAILGAGLSFLMICLSCLKKPLSPHPRSFYTLLLFISLSFLFIGPGLYAFDLPL